MISIREMEKLARVIRDHAESMETTGLDGNEKSLVEGFLYGIAGDIGDVVESSDDSLDREAFLALCGF